MRANEGGNAVSEHHQRADARKNHSGRVTRRGVADGEASHRDAETQENKANYLIPQAQSRLHDGGHNVTHELPAYLECQPFPHAHMVAKGATRIRAGLIASC